MSSYVSVGRLSSSKKRSLVETPQSGDDDRNERKEPPVRRPRTSQTTTPSTAIVTTTTSPHSADWSLESRLAPLQVRALQQQLDHERNLRALDAKKAKQVQQRLERQIQFVMDEANEHKTMLVEFQQETEKHTAELQHDRDKALEELRECQIQLSRLEEAASYQYALAQEKQSKILLQSKLDAKTKEAEGLKDELDKLQQQLRETLTRKEVSSGLNVNDGASSPAPKAMLRELNEVRIQLAESQRQYRQLQRSTQQWHDHAKLYVKEKETSRSAKARVTSLEEQLRQSQSSYENLLAKQAAWKEFAISLRQQLHLDAAASEPEEEASLEAPPEVSTIIRHMKASEQQLQDAIEQRSSIQRRLEQAEQELETSRKTIQEKEMNESRWERERKQLQKTLELSQRDVETMQAMERIWKREADNFRALMETYDDLPAMASSSSTALAQQSSMASTATNPKVASLELRISTLQEELKLVQEEKTRLTEDKNAMAVERDALQQEQDRLQTRLAKIQAAFMAERHKAQEAEDRSGKLEALVGKGAFNPEESRALHLKRNPLAEAIQAKYESEIQVLKKRLAEITTGGVEEDGDSLDAVNVSSMSAATAGIGTPHFDPEKLHQRLRESFTEHAALFREAVYLLTGYKVDMLGGRARPTFRVRSVYAEQEQDELIFMWPKNSKDQGATSLDLMDTPFAKVLSTTDSYQFLTKFKSIPSFMASVQLSLFDKTTIVV